MNKQHLPLLPGRFYHVFNRAVGDEVLFRSAENYSYFLEKMKHHLLPVCDLFAYSLLPNHFHLLVRIKEEDVVREYFDLKKGKAFDAHSHDLSDFIMEQFSNWLNGYTKAFNKMYARKGGLFIDYLKRSEANNELDITNFIFYVHKNAVHHGLAKKIGDWEHDSFEEILADIHTVLMRDEIIAWFGSKQQFIELHEQPVELKIDL